MMNSGHPKSPQVIKRIQCWLIVTKSITLVFGLAMVILFSVPTEKLPSTMVWSCSGGPEDGCARIVMFPILFGTLAVLIDIGMLVLIVLAVTNPVAGWINVAWAAIEGVIYFVCTMVTMFATIRLDFPPEQAGNGTATLYPKSAIQETSHWRFGGIMLGVFAATSAYMTACFHCHALRAQDRIRDAPVIIVNTPWQEGQVDVVQGAGAGGPPTMEQGGPIKKE